MWNKTRCHKRPCLWRPCPQILVFAVLSSLYNILHKDVEQGKLSQASVPLATMLKTLVCAVRLFLYGLRVADSGLTNSSSETETQCNKWCNLLLNAIVSWMSNYHVFPPNDAEAQVSFYFYV